MSARVPTTEITGLYGGLLKFAMRKMLGKVPDSAGAGEAIVKLLERE